MTLNPSDDFLSWGAIFLTSIEPSGDYAQLIPDYVELTKQLTQNSQLSEPLSNFTEHFLVNIVATAVSKTLNLSNLWDNDLAQVTDFLKVSLSLIPWCFSHYHIDYIPNILQIFNKLNHIFSTEISLHTDLLRYFIQNKYLDDMVNAINEETTIAHYGFLITLYKTFQSDFYISMELNKNVFIQLGHHFVSFFSSKDLRDLESQYLLDTMRCFTELVLDLTLDEFRSPLLAFAKKTLMTDMMSKQMVGATILNIFSVTPYWLSHWKDKNEVVTFLLETNLHQNLLTLLQPAFSNLLNKDQLLLFFNKAKSAHSSLKSIILNIVANALSTLDDAEIVSIIETVSESDRIEFLTVAAKNLERKKPDIFKTILCKLLETNKIEALEQFCKFETPNQTRAFLITTCSSHMRDNIFYVEILKKLFSTKYGGAQEFGSDFTDQVVEAVKEKTATRDSLLDLLLEILMKDKGYLGNTLFDSLFENGVDDSLLLFYKALMSKKGLKALDTPTLKKIGQLQFDFENASPILVEFLRTYILLINYKKKYLKDEHTIWTQVEPPHVPKNFVITHIPLSHDKLLFTLLEQSQSEEVAKDTQKFLLTLYTQTKDVSVRDLTLVLVNKFKESETETAQRRTLQLLSDFIERYEMAVDSRDFGVMPHKARKNGMRRININVLMPNGKTVFMDANPEISPSIFRERIANYLKTSASNVQMLHQGMSFINYHSLMACGIRDGSRVTVTQYSNYGGTSLLSTTEMGAKLPPTIQLDKIGFSSVCLDILEKTQDPIISKLCRKLLNRMPDDPNLIALLDDMPQFLASLTANEATFNYKLVLLSKHLETQLGQETFESVNGIETLIGFIEKRGNTFKGFVQCLVIIDHVFSADSCLPILPIALHNATGKAQEASIDLLFDFSQDLPHETTLCVNEHLDDLETAIRTMSSKNWSRFITFIRRLDDLTKVFEMVYKNIDDPTAPYFVDTFSAILRDVKDTIDISSILEKSMQLLPKSDGHTFTALCQVVSTIIEENRNLSQFEFPFLESVLRRAFSTTDTNEQKAIFTLVQTIHRPDSVYPIVSEMLEFETDRWNYTPESHVRSEFGYLGLRNMGATCYMNSIFQQLFFTFPFRKLVLSKFLEKDGQKEFQGIFSRLLLGQTKSVDTQTFIENWKGWNKKVVNPKEQQDAFEFFQILLDQLPKEFYSLFQGTIVNTIENEEEGYSSPNFEQFYTIQMEIKTLKNVYESFNEFVQKELFEDYFAEQLQKKIKAYKFARIKDAPPCLVLQLKRFEYDYTSFERRKINERYEFPTVLNIKQCLEQEEDMYYDLYGVVLHAGTARGGHYTSLRHIHDKWYLFNDSEISVVNETEFEQLSFGGKQQNVDEYDAGPCAYLLFYIRQGATVDIDGLVCDFVREPKIPILPELIDPIEAENAKYARMQCLFGEPILHFITSLESPELLMEYFVRIYCHSSLEKYDHHILSKLRQVDSSFAIKYLTSHVKPVVDIFTNCSSTSITSIFTDFISTTLSLTGCEESSQFIDELIDSLPSVLTVWRQIPIILKPIRDFITRYSYHAVEHNWANRLLTFITMVYSRSQSSMFLKGVDLSSIFQSLAAISTFDTSVLVTHAASIQQSESHSKAFVKMMKKLLKKKQIPLHTLLSVISSSKSDDIEDEMVSIIREGVLACTSGPEITTILDQFNSTKKGVTMKSIVGDFLSLLIEDDPGVRNMFFTYPRETLFRFLIHPDDTVRSNTVHLFVELFPRVPKLPNMPVRIITQPVRRTFSRQRSPKISDADKADLISLLDQLVQFLVEQGDDISVFYNNNPSNPQWVLPSDFYLLLAVQILSWMMTLTNHFTEEYFESLSSLVVILCEHDSAPDVNIAELSALLLQFDYQLVEPCVQMLFETTFKAHHRYTEYDLAEHFKPFIPIMKKMSDEELDPLFDHPAMGAIISAAFSHSKFQGGEDYIDFLMFLVDKKRDKSNHIDTLFNDAFGVRSEFKYNHSTCATIFGRYQFLIGESNTRNLFQSCFDELDTIISRQHTMTNYHMEEDIKTILEVFSNSPDWLPYCDDIKLKNFVRAYSILTDKWSTILEKIMDLFMSSSNYSNQLDLAFDQLFSESPSIDCTPSGVCSVMMNWIKLGLTDINQITQTGIGKFEWLTRDRDLTGLAPLFEFLISQKQHQIVVAAFNSNSIKKISDSLAKSFSKAFKSLTPEEVNESFDSVSMTIHNSSDIYAKQGYIIIWRPDMKDELLQKFPLNNWSQCHAYGISMIGDKLFPDEIPSYHRNPPIRSYPARDDTDDDSDDDNNTTTDEEDDIAEDVQPRTYNWDGSPVPTPQSLTGPIITPRRINTTSDDDDDDDGFYNRKTPESPVVLESLTQFPSLSSAAEDYDSKML